MSTVMKFLNKPIFNLNPEDFIFDDKENLIARVWYFFPNGYMVSVIVEKSKAVRDNPYEIAVFGVNELSELNPKDNKITLGDVKQNLYKEQVINILYSVSMFKELIPNAESIIKNNWIIE